MNIGDRVIVEKSGRKYGITQDGSEGIVEGIYGGDFGEASVRFDKLTGCDGEKGIGKAFEIETAYLRVLQPVQNRPIEPQRQESKELTIVWKEKELSFPKELVQHKTVHELLERFSKAYDIDMPVAHKAESDMGVVYSESAIVDEMRPETSKLNIVELEEETPYGREEETPEGYEPTTEEDGEVLYKDTKEDAVQKAGITRNELEKVTEALEALKELFDDNKELIESFINKVNAL